MSEWTSFFKVGLTITLLVGLIASGIGLAVTGEMLRSNSVNKISETSDNQTEIYSFNGLWVDKASSFQLACSCIGKPVILKIDSKDHGMAEVNLNAPSVRNNLEKLIDRERFLIKVSENNNKTVISFERM